MTPPTSGAQTPTALHPQEEYAVEGLEWSFVSYQDNQPCLELIEGSPVSICSLINEVGGSLACRAPRAGLWAFPGTSRPTLRLFLSVCLVGSPAL